MKDTLRLLLRTWVLIVAIADIVSKVDALVKAVKQAFARDDDDEEEPD